MCWKQITSREGACELIKVILGANADAVNYTGIYLPNKHNEGEYFKLGSKGFHTLYRTSSNDGKKEAWAFRKGVGNYEYISTSQTDYATYANPFSTGYGDSNLSVLCTTLTTEGIYTQRSGGLNLIKVTEELTEGILEPVKEEETGQAHQSHAEFIFSEDLPVPQVDKKIKNSELYDEDVEEIEIEWAAISNIEGYRLEMYREEKGIYESTIYDLIDNKFTYKPQGGNYFFRIKTFTKEDGQFVHGAYSEVYKFTKLYPGNCPEENITLHFDKYEDKHIYVKIEGTWYGTGNKYGEPVSMVNFPCPVTIEDYDYENEPQYISIHLGRDPRKIIRCVNCEKYESGMDFAKDIKEKYGDQFINQSCTISSIFKFK